MIKQMSYLLFILGVATALRRNRYRTHHDDEDCDDDDDWLYFEPNLKTNPDEIRPDDDDHDDRWTSRKCCDDSVSNAFQTRSRGRCDEDENIGGVGGIRIFCDDGKDTDITSQSRKYDDDEDDRTCTKRWADNDDKIKCELNNDYLDRVHVVTEEIDGKPYIKSVRFSCSEDHKRDDFDTTRTLECPKDKYVCGLQTLNGKDKTREVDDDAVLDLAIKCCRKTIEPTTEPPEPEPPRGKKCKHDEWETTELQECDRDEIRSWRRCCPEKENDRDLHLAQGYDKRGVCDERDHSYDVYVGGIQLQCDDRDEEELDQPHSTNSCDFEGGEELIHCDISSERLSEAVLIISRDRNGLDYFEDITFICEEDDKSNERAGDRQERLICKRGQRICGHAMCLKEITIKENGKEITVWAPRGYEIACCDAHDIESKCPKDGWFDYPTRLSTFDRSKDDEGKKLCCKKGHVVKAFQTLGRGTCHNMHKVYNGVAGIRLTCTDDEVLEALPEKGDYCVDRWKDNGNKKECAKGTYMEHVDAVIAEKDGEDYISSLSFGCNMGRRGDDDDTEITQNLHCKGDDEYFCGIQIYSNDDNDEDFASVTNIFVVCCEHDERKSRDDDGDDDPFEYSEFGRGRSARDRSYYEPPYIY